MLSPGKIGQVLCLGNVTDRTTLKFLENLSPDYQPVKGQYDDDTTLPLSKVVTHGSLRIGFNSGHTIVPNGDPDALLILARQLDVDILIWGGTHRVEAYQLEGKFFINPGSATGAFYTGWPDIEDLEDSEDETKNENDDMEKENKSTKDDEGSKDPIPSFCLLDIQGAVCVLYIYSYVDGEVKVDKISYRKEF